MSMKFNNQPTKAEPVLKLKSTIKFGKFKGYTPKKIIDSDDKELLDAFASYVFWCKNNKVAVDNRILYLLKQKGYTNS